MPPKKDAAAKVADLAGAALSTSQAFCLTGPRMGQCQNEAPVAWAAFAEEDAAQKQEGIASEAFAFPQADLLVAQKQVDSASEASAFPQADLMSVGRSGQSGPVFQP
jgi:hypothetical protein